MNAIAATVVGGLLLTVIVYVAKSWFGTQPKLRVRVLGELSSSFANHPDSITCKWQKSLELYNSTAFSALSIAFIWPDPTRQLPIPELEPPHVNTMETRNLKFSMEKDFPRETVLACRDRFKELLPNELETTILILRYENEKGITFYTRYERNGDVENSTFHRFRPKP